MATNKELPREPTVPPRSGFVGTFLLSGCLMARSSYPATIQLWQSRYEQFQNSKLSVEQFCDSIGCCKSALYYWRRIFAGSSQVSATPQDRVEGSRTRSFVPVLVRTTESQSREAHVLGYRWSRDLDEAFGARKSAAPSAKGRCQACCHGCIGAQSASFWH